MDEYESLQAEARRLGICPRRAVRLVARGLVQARLIGMNYVIRRGALDSFAKPQPKRQTQLV